MGYRDCEYRCHDFHDINDANIVDVVDDFGGGSAKFKDNSVREH